MFNVCPECEHVAPGTRQWERVECPGCGNLVVMKWVPERRRQTHDATLYSMFCSVSLAPTLPVVPLILAVASLPFSLILLLTFALSVVVLGTGTLLAFVGNASAPTGLARVALVLAVLLDCGFLLILMCLPR